MGDTCVPSLIVISIAIYQLETKVSLKTICCLRLFIVVYKPLHTVVFINAVIYICIETFVHKTSILFSYNMDTCIAIIMFARGYF